MCEHFSRHKVRALQYTFEQIDVVKVFPVIAEECITTCELNRTGQNNQLNKRKIYLNRVVQEYRYKELFCTSVAWRSC
jgi:hypothetical protein